jgi:uncharacterized protein YndB with AHSA1/START domain
MRVSSEVVLPAGVEAAWEALTDWESQAAWMKDADWVRVEGDRRAGVGTRIAVKTRIYNVPLFAERMEVLTWEPPRRLVMAHRTFVRGTGEWLLQEMGASATMFRWTEDVTIPPPVLGDMAAFVYRPFMSRLMAGSMRDLVSHLER